MKADEWGDRHTNGIDASGLDWSDTSSCTGIVLIYK